MYPRLLHFPDGHRLRVSAGTGVSEEGDGGLWWDQTII